VGNLPPLLGLSIQLANAESLFRSLQATKCAQPLARELHFSFACLLDVVTRIGPSGAPFLCGAGNFTYSSEEN
jgi:hypothetical protein